MNILIVDDQPVNLAVLRAQLEAEGHAVLEAAHGVEALALLEHQPVDAVISDILMPKMDGYSLCHEVRRSARFHDLPFIMYTASYTSPSDEKFSYDLGADKYLKKPASGADIQAALAEVTGAARRARNQSALRDETAMLKEYNERLVYKLEEKNTELSATVEQLLKLSRTQSVLSGISNLIVRVRHRVELLQEACRIAVEQGGFRLAWIALLQGDQAVPVAFFGDDHGLMQDLRFSLRPEGPNGSGPAARALRENRPCTVNDFASDTGIAPHLLAAAQQLGIRAFTAHPLTVKGSVAGCLGLYAVESNFFDDEEMKLLSELAGDISYAMEFILREEEIGNLALYDPLTRLPNRTLFLRRLAGFIQDAHDHTTRVAVLMLDVEHFKSFNDALRQSGDDDVLKRVADRLKYLSGGPSFMARIAGDRFAVVVPEIPASADLDAHIQRQDWTRLGEPIQIAGQELAVSFNLGAAVFPEDAEEPERLLRNAEIALKQGKYRRRGYTRYTRDMEAAAAEKLKLERRMRQALKREQFVLHYQPKVDLRSGTISGAEALIRWQDPEQGLIPPLKFIPLLEETGLILEVGRWVLEQVGHDYSNWLKEGLSPPRVAVNVSQAQLVQPDFVDTVLATLAKRAGGPHTIELEITESMLMTDLKATIQKLKNLRDLGLHIAIDDFGTGYSSLGYLARLPLNAVKIDGTFVMRMTENADTMTIVSAITSMAHSMNLRVVAEGVETAEQLKFLRLLKCDEIQGSLFSMPLPAAEFAALLRSGKKLV